MMNVDIREYTANGRFKLRISQNRKWADKNCWENSYGQKKLGETTNLCVEIMWYKFALILNLSIMYSDVSGFIYSKQKNGNWKSRLTERKYSGLFYVFQFQNKFNRRHWKCTYGHWGNGLGKTKLWVFPSLFAFAVGYFRRTINILSLNFRKEQNKSNYCSRRQTPPHLILSEPIWY